MIIKQTEYKSRREKFISQLGKNSIAILPSANEIIRNGDVNFPFRQNSNFYYLTGFNEPEAVAVFFPDFTQGEYILFCREHDPIKEQWEGLRVGQDGACKQFAADQSYSITELDKVIAEMLPQCKQIYFPIGRDEKFDERVMQWVNELRAKNRSGITAPDDFVNIEHILHEMRLIKSDAEISTMQKAADITAIAHKRALQICKPGVWEYEVEAEIICEFRRQGSSGPAYPSIVGAGANACVIHYMENNCKLEDESLILIDAGAEYENYASDVTRTFPVNGKFNTEQRAIYELVLQAQLAGIAAVKPGNHWKQAQNKIVQIITAGLVELGLLQGEIEQLIEDNSYRDFYMHNSGHWLGLDTHDVGDYKINDKWRELQPGMVVTVEPGIYISEHTQNIDPKWYNIACS